ncbi:MAG: hypothetical protein LBQ34_07565 [Alphaproteobacteria bacterium]|nr:hypothetical protein [Alphaproteobacteria bacterium]
MKLKIAPTLLSNVLMEYMGIANDVNNILSGIEDSDKIQNPFLLLVSTMLATRQRTSTTYINVGDMYYA